MASIGHIAVGMAAARIYRVRQPTRAPIVRPMITWSALSMLPDADVVGFPLGVAYAAAWGHRGATHSLLFSIAIGSLAGLFACVLRLPVARTIVLAVAVVASHALLDTLTDGGHGCALLWPLDHTRYFAPCRPIPVAPIGFAFLSRTGLHVALTELALFSPMLVYALWPRRRGHRAGQL